LKEILSGAPALKGVFDAANALQPEAVKNLGRGYSGIGRGTGQPHPAFVETVYESFRLMERGIGNEVERLCDFFNEHYATDDFNKVHFKEVQNLARSCSTGCEIADSGPIDEIPEYKGFKSELVTKAFENALKKV
jgi:hypothetical protein